MMKSLHGYPDKFMIETYDGLLDRFAAQQLRYSDAQLVFFYKAAVHISVDDIRDCKHRVGQVKESEGIFQSAQDMSSLTGNMLLDEFF